VPAPEDLDPDMQYVWGLRYIDDLVLRDRDTSGNGTLDERLYALQDANWNVVALADSDGDVVERYLYSAYGDPLVLNADFAEDSDGTDYAWEFRFTGRRTDLETELMYYRNRMYHPGLGRFVSRDPGNFDPWRPRRG
jgi:RHS repeat-associated protein